MIDSKRHRGEHLRFNWQFEYGINSMSYDKASNLWPNKSASFFRSLSINPLLQDGPTCVSTVLAMLSGQTPRFFQGKINTQDPVSWSAALAEFGMKLAYCPTDVRRLKFYLEELKELDDLFTLSYYSPNTDLPEKDAILKDPDDKGWICSSHIVILHRDKIIDPQFGKAVEASEHHCGERFTKRIFRVVPVDCARGL